MYCFTFSMNAEAGATFETMSVSVTSLRLIYQLFVLFNVIIKHGMWAIIPVVLGIGMNTKVLPQVKTTLNDRVDVLLEVCIVVHWLVEQEQQVPVAVLAGITPSTRTVKIQFAALWKHIAGHLPDAI